MPCRAYLALCALSLAFGCMVGLVVANRLLLALDDAQGRSRRGATDVLRQETQWPMTGGPQRDDFQHRGNIEYPNDGGATAYISERN